MSQRKKVILLGATGSIGGSALRVIEQHSDRLELVAVVARTRFDALLEIARQYAVRHLALYEPDTALNEAALPAGARLHRGVAGVTELIESVDADLVLVASAGTAALKPTLAAIERGRTIALANKEILVLAGRFMTEAARRHGARIIPVDSEHNAIFQCLDGGSPRHIHRLLLTASGGPFRDLPIERLPEATLEQALEHPNWSMGPKVTIDSATMANKGLEIIEARWLFDTAPDRIDVVVHPQSVVHSMVEYVDGSILAQLSPPSMTFAIQHALLYPERATGVVPTLDFSEVLRLDFQPPEPARYPCLGLAREALARGGNSPAVFNAANEVAVEGFLDGRIRFLEIPEIIGKTMDQISVRDPDSLDEILGIEAEARALATERVAR